MQTTFAVSNTDVVTMVMVEQKAILTAKRIELSTRLTLLRIEVEKEINKLYKEQLAKINPAIVENFKAFVEALNPGKPFDIRLGRDELDFYRENYSRYNFLEYKYNSDTVELRIILPDTKIEDQDDDDEEDVDQDEYDNTYYSYNLPNGHTAFSVKAKIRVHLKLPAELSETSRQIDEIDGLLRNEQVFKDKIIASVTKKAIANIPSMQELTADIKELKLLSF